MTTQVAAKTAKAAGRTTGPGRHVYDVVVLGGQLGGVLSASLLAKRGLHVLYIEHDDAGMGYVHEDWRLPIAPFVLPPLKAIPALDELLAELGVATAIHRLVKPTTPPLQLLRAREWLDLLSEPAARQAELTRALGTAAAEPLGKKLSDLGRCADAADAFVQARPGLPPDGLIARWKLGRLVARTPALAIASPLEDDEAHGRLLRRMAGFVCQLEAPPPLGWSRCLGKVLVAPHVYPGGRSALREALAERARELGVDVLGSEDSVGAIVFEGSRPVGVRLTRGETVYRTDAIVAACDLGTLKRLVPESRRKPVDQLSAPLEPKRAVFTLNVVVPEPALPRGLGELALLETDDFELGALLLQVSPARRESAEVDAPGERTLSVSTVVNLAQHQGGAPAVQALCTRLWAELDHVMPFTRSQALVESTPWLDVPAIANGTFEPAPLFPTPEGSALGVCGLPTAGPWKRFFVASRQVLPGLGVEGEALAAARAVRQVEHALNRNDPLKGRASA